MQIVFPHPMDDFDWSMTEAKGWIEVTLRTASGDRRVTFYYPARLAQEVASALGSDGYFSEGEIVVVPSVTKDATEAALTRLR